MKIHIKQALLTITIFISLSSKIEAMKSFYALFSSGEEHKTKRLSLPIEKKDNDPAEEKRNAFVSFTFLDQSHIDDQTFTQEHINIENVFEPYVLGEFNYDALRRVIVNSSPEVTIDLVELLAERSPNISLLNFNDCPKLTVFGTRGNVQKSTLWVKTYSAEFPALQDLIINNCPVQTLKVKGNQLLTADLRNNSNLSYLSVRGTRVTLIHLDGSNALTDNVLDKLPETCPSLLRMTCQECHKLRSIKIREQLPMLSTETQNVSREEYWQKLADQREQGKLIDWTIKYETLNSKMTSELSRIPLLTRLKLDQVSIGDFDVKTLLGHPTLKSFYVMSDQLVQIVGDHQVVQMLGNISQLASSFLASYMWTATPIEVPNIEEIWFVNCKELKEIRLTGERMTRLKATGNIALKSVGVTSHSVKKLNFSQSGITLDCVEALKLSCPNYERLVIKDCPNLPFLPAFGQESSDTEQGPTDLLFNLGNLELTSTELTTKKATRIGQLQINSLNIHYSAIRPHALSKLVNLVTLALHGCKFDGEQLLEIIHLRKLKYFILSDTEIDPEVTKSLVLKSDLDFLQLTNTRVTECGAQNIFSILFKKKKPHVLLQDTTVSPDMISKINNLNKLNSKN